MDMVESPEEVSGLSGGFPCQAHVFGFCVIVTLCFLTFYMLPMMPMCVCQGTSKAGKKGGMSDQRTALLTHFFRLWDASPQLPPASKYEIEKWFKGTVGKSKIGNPSMFLGSSCSWRMSPTSWRRTWLPSWNS